MSPPEKRFELPEHPRLSIIHKHVSPEQIAPAFIRNTLALKVETPMICHVNADCFYAPNFAEVVIRELSANKAHLIMCRRRDIFEKQWGEIKSGAKKFKDFKGLRLESVQACGECQGLMKDVFLKLGGYHKWIKNGKSTKTKDRKGSYWEDSFLKNKFGGKRKMIEGQTWLLHMFHPKRQSKVKLEKK